MTDKTKTKTCPRCGLKLGAITIRHTNACKKTPPPLELATLFINNHDASLNSLSEDYGTTRRFIRTHIEHGAELIYGAGGGKCIITEIHDRAEALRVSSVIKFHKTKSAKRHVCANCKILLDHPKVTAVGGLCSICAGKEPKHYMTAVLSEVGI